MAQLIVQLFLIGAMILLLVVVFFFKRLKSKRPKTKAIGQPLFYRSGPHPGQSGFKRGSQDLSHLTME